MTQQRERYSAQSTSVHGPGNQFPQMSTRATATPRRQRATSIASPAPSQQSVGTCQSAPAPSCDQTMSSHAWAGEIPSVPASPRICHPREAKAQKNTAPSTRANPQRAMVKSREG
jgi:hypothetical protein